MRVIGAVVFQLFVLMLAIAHKASPEREILFAVCLAHPVITWFSPSDGVGGAGWFVNILEPLSN